MRTTAKERAEVVSRLTNLGIEYQDCEALRRISMTLHRWFEMECGDGNDYCSWSIERDEQTDKPYLCRYPHTGKMTRHRIADKERGAEKRLKAIIAKYPALLSYIQCDCRGAAIYILRSEDVRPGERIDSVYSRGIAVY